MHLSPIPKCSSSRATGLLDEIHTDVACPPPVISNGGAKYFVIFFDDKSRLLTVYPIKSKSDCFDFFCLFRKRVKPETGRKLKAMRLDGGGEYMSSEFRTFLEDNGIYHQQTCAYIPQQNGVAERMNRTSKDLTRSMLKQRNLADKFWAEAVVPAA